MTDERYWAWCDECRAWVGSEPPLLPPYWPNSKAAAMHKAGTGHRADLVTFDQARAIVAKEQAASV